MSKITSHEKEETRKKILSVCRKLFLEKGFSNVNMRLISKEVGIGTSTIYGYFDTKMNLFFDAFIIDLNKTVELNSKIVDNFNGEINLDTLVTFLSYIMTRQLNEILKIGKDNLKMFYNFINSEGYSDEMYSRITSMIDAQDLVKRVLEKAKEDGKVLVEFDFEKASKLIFNIIMQSVIKFLNSEIMTIEELEANIKDQLNMFFVGKIEI